MSKGSTIVVIYLFALSIFQQGEVMALHREIARQKLVVAQDCARAMEIGAMNTTAIKIFLAGYLPPIP